MHEFLKTVGFGDIRTEKELEPFLRMTIEDPDFKLRDDGPTGEIDDNFVEWKNEFGERIGLAVCGSYTDEYEEKYRIDYYYPYFRGEISTTEEPVEVEKHSDKEAYSVICDDYRLGVTLIYFLLNIIDYKCSKAYPSGKVPECYSILAGLAMEGKVLLPVSDKDRNKKLQQKNFERRTTLLTAAKEGDEEAIETLTMEDIDTYSSISKRVDHEDILSIVDTCIMPYGIESDHYEVIGEILGIEQTENFVSKDIIYILTIQAKDIIFDICINKKDLLGEPAVGRRFKGIIWMQGELQPME